MGYNKLNQKELYALSSAAADLYRITNRGELVQKIALVANEALSVEHVAVWDIDFTSMDQKTLYANPESAVIIQKSWPIYIHFCERYPQFSQAITNPQLAGKIYRSTELLPPAFPVDDEFPGLDAELGGRAEEPRKDDALRPRRDVDEAARPRGHMRAGAKPGNVHRPAAVDLQER